MTAELSIVSQLHSIRPWNVAYLDDGKRKVNGIQDIEFRHYNYYPAGMKEIEGPDRMKLEVMIVSIDGKKYDPKFIKTLAKNEGFDDLLEFHKYFWLLKNFKGKIIHYTDFRYK